MYKTDGAFLSCGIIFAVAMFVAAYFFYKKVKGDSGVKSMIILSVTGIFLYIFTMYWIFIRNWDGDWLSWLGTVLYAAGLAFMVYALITHIRALKESQQEEHVKQ